MASKANKCSDFSKKVGTGWLAVLGNYDIMRRQAAIGQAIETKEKRIKNK